MIIRKIISVLVICMISAMLFNCNPDEIILHTDIQGYVTDASTMQAVDSVTIVLLPANDTIYSGTDGRFIFKNLLPGNYEIKASKIGFTSGSEYINTNSEKTYNISFLLDRAPIPRIDKKYLDFGFDSTLLTFTVSNLGLGKITYLFVPSQEWITVSPLSCDVTSEPNIINVTLNRTGLPDKTIEETIKIISVLGEDVEFDTVKVWLNGIMDTISNYYYKTVKIGTQVWMKENLKVTRFNDGTSIPYLTGKNEWTEVNTPAFCWYKNNEANKDIYGGLYNWHVINTGRLCPSGWHVPSELEWKVMENYLMNNGYVFDGTISNKIGQAMASDLLWTIPTSDFEIGAVGSTDYPAFRNLSEFSALPGGNRQPDGQFYGISRYAHWWSTQEASPDQGSNEWLGFDLCGIFTGFASKKNGFSVRCLKD